MHRPAGTGGRPHTARGQWSRLPWIAPTASKVAQFTGRGRPYDPGPEPLSGRPRGYHSSPGTGSAAGTLASTCSNASRLPRPARTSRYSSPAQAANRSRTASTTHAASAAGSPPARRATSARTSGGDSYP